MNEFKGTPGPWEVDGVEIYPVSGHRASDAICTMQPGFLDADAALIAAAPELLNALRGFVAQADALNLGGWDWEDEIDLAKSAMAKALGEKS